MDFLLILLLKLIAVIALIMYVVGFFLVVSARVSGGKITRYDIQRGATWPIWFAVFVLSCVMVVIGPFIWLLLFKNKEAYKDSKFCFMLDDYLSK